MAETKKRTDDEIRAAREMLNKTGDQLMAEFAKNEGIDLTKPISVANGGEQIILPTGMELLQGVFWLIANITEQKRIVQISETINASPLDGAVAFNRVLIRRFGWASLKDTTVEGFIGKFKEPPNLISVQIGPNETIQVPWGNLQIPGINGTVGTGYTKRNNGFVFQLTAEVERNSEGLVHEIAEAVRHEVRTNSIYNGQAIEVVFRDDRGRLYDEFQPMHAPTFLDTAKIRDDTAVYNEDTEELMQACLHKPIIHTQQFRDFGMPLKSGVLLSGPFGTGKTLAAHRLAKLCVQNKWTFIVVKNILDMARGIEFARQYQPAVLFIEDIDESTQGERDHNMNELLETFDGINAKETEVIILCTTNRADRINPAFQRPGRFDVVIPIDLPNSATTIRLARLYGGEQLTGRDEELAEALEPVEGRNAAVIGEVVQRAKRFAIGRQGDTLTITPADLRMSAITMNAQLRLVDEATEREHDEGDESVEKALKTIMEKAGVA